MSAHDIETVSSYRSDCATLALWAEDLRALAWLHAAEREPGLLSEAHAAGLPAQLALDGLAPAVVRSFDHALGQIGDLSADELAADYAAIYLTNAYRASPCESVWRDEDGLMLQQPTFDVRDFFRRNRLAAANWREMSDDHIALELEFLAALLERSDAAEALRFLDKHIMIWVPAFAQAVESRAATTFYRALAGLTSEYCACLQKTLSTESPVTLQSSA